MRYDTSYITINSPDEQVYLKMYGEFQNMSKRSWLITTILMFMLFLDASTALK